MRNLKLAFRTLFKTPFVTTVAILSLALGIGANAAIFSLFDQFLLRPLPVAEPDRLVNLGSPGPKPGSTKTCRTILGWSLASFARSFPGKAGPRPRFAPGSGSATRPGLSF